MHQLFLSFLRIISKNLTIVLTCGLLKTLQATPAEVSPISNPLEFFPAERYSSLWQNSCFGIKKTEAIPTTPSTTPPLDGLELVGLLNRQDNPVALIRNEGSSEIIEVSNTATGAPLQLLEVQLGVTFENTRVKLKNLRGEGWLTFSSTQVSLPQNSAALVSAPTTQTAPQSTNSTSTPQANNNNRRGNGNWSEDERNQAKERVTNELTRAKEMLQQAQDPTERSNIESRIQRLENFLERLNSAD